ncbi:pentatricopeptide repeat-containing protein 1, mitochondrial [Caerostris darwini]|uniref:Pentatricopeptide repeat-containing protein 1, mitochondrial n=1 Tax=Caerostris darwini TaxID=1538125 RepID=A0AAV4VQZ1_9ARAC|nr:pentatricopeptide repeat-containing protein 1, mitochondrial [Caerostris darwini]
MSILCHNYRSITCLFIKSYIDNCNSTKNSCRILYHNYSKISSVEEPISSVSKSDIVCEDKGDIFGSLRKPLERTKFNRNLKSRGDKKDVKVIKIKNKPKPNQFNNPDVFGKLSDKNPVWYPDIHKKSIIDNDQSDDSVIVRNISKYHKDPKVYLEKMKHLVLEKKLKEALELFIDMKRNFVTPLHGHYTFMIGACGRFGYTEMAFKLFRQMTDRGFKPTCATLTGLFNACAESPFPDYGLRKANFLKEKIKTKNYKLNQVAYHSMIKAFGKCGDILTAFQIVDEMVKEKIKIDSSTYCFLLMCCITDKEAGFTHAVEVWRKMKERKCSPNLFAFNLLLRAVRDCDVGPEEISYLLLQHWSSYSKRPYGFKVKEALPKKQILLLSSPKTYGNDSNVEKSFDKPAETKPKAENITNQIPEGLNTLHDNQTLEEHVNVDFCDAVNESGSTLPIKRAETSVVSQIGNEGISVLQARPVNCDGIVDIRVIKTSSDRLALIGGVENILIDMKKVSVKPNVKTFTLLLGSLPPTIEAEEQLMDLFDIYGVKPDVGFFNQLIKRRNYRFDYAAAQQVLLLLNKWSLSPDLITFGSLAVGCVTYNKAKIFVNDMRKLGYSPNIEIVGALLNNACKIVDFEFIQNTLELIAELEIDPDEKMLKSIEDCLEISRKNIINMEHGKNVSYVYKRKDFQKEF